MSSATGDALYCYLVLSLWKHWAWFNKTWEHWDLFNHKSWFEISRQTSRKGAKEGQNTRKRAVCEGNCRRLIVWVDLGIPLLLGGVVGILRVCLSARQDTFVWESAYIITFCCCHSSCFLTALSWFTALLVSHIIVM